MVRYAARSYLKPSNCILLAKKDRLEQAQEAFKNTGVGVQLDGSKDKGVAINTNGTHHLRAAVGTKDFQYEYVQNKINEWTKYIEKVTAIPEPHAAYASYTLPTK